MSLPKEISSIGGEEFVIIVLWSSLSERRMARVEDEKNNTESKKIYVFTQVGLTGKYFRSHIAWGTDLATHSTRAIATFETARSIIETCDFDVLHFIDEDIFRFEITMRKTPGMDVIDTH